MNEILSRIDVFGEEIVWFELFHWVASPSTLESSLPRHFRAVLFMDVFGDADDPITGSASLGAEPMEMLHEATGNERKSLRKL